MTSKTRHIIKSTIRWSFILFLIFTQFVSFDPIYAQGSQQFPDNYDEATWAPKLDSLREAIGKKVKYKNGEDLELATLLALSHYPMLQQRKIQIIVKDQSGAPIEASFSMWNFVKSRKGKIYKIIIQEGSFLGRMTLNRQVSALAHEMAHFIQYDRKGYIGTLTTLLGWVTSKKARIRFEKGADKIAIFHDLGPQLLDFAFYTRDEEIRQLMQQKASGN